MSRSYKKPYWTDQNSGKRDVGPAKRQANRKVRAAVKKAIEQDKHDVADGKAFRKVSCSYSIRDWSFEDKKNPKASRK